MNRSSISRLAGVACGVLGVATMVAAGGARSEPYTCELWCNNSDPPTLLATWECISAEHCCGQQNCTLGLVATTCCAPPYACLKYNENGGTGQPHAECVVIP